jgi:hypothetical protein
MIVSRRPFDRLRAGPLTALRTGFFVGADCGSAPTCGRGQVFGLPVRVRTQTGLDSRKDLRHPCTVFHALERLLAVQQHGPQLPLEHRAPCVRVICRPLCRTSEHRLSIQLCQIKVKV